MSDPGWKTKVRGGGRPLTSESGKSSTLRDLAKMGRGASGAISSTAVNSVGNLVLQVLAARTLGAATYGAYTIFFGILVLLSAVHTAWVGDSLTVMDRFDARVRTALVQSLAIIAFISALVALAVAMLLRLSDAHTALIFTGLVILWLIEETFRRLFMARVEFWKLVLNDSIYVVSSLLAIAALRWSTGSLSLGLILGAMVIGCCAAIMAGVLQLPSAELRLTPLVGGGGRDVASFAAWRAAQAGIRPLAHVLTRVLVGLLASNAALGRMEAARLLVAPAFTVVAGASLFLLSTYANQSRERASMSTASVRLSMLVFLAVTVGYGTFAVILADPLSELLTAESFTLDRVQIIGWAVFAAGFALGLPPACYAVARHQARSVFQIRILDSGLGLGLAAVALATDRVSLVPWAIATGSLLGAALLLRLAERPAPALEDVITPEGSQQDQLVPPREP